MDEKSCYFIVDEQEPISMSVNRPKLADCSLDVLGRAVFLCLLNLLDVGGILRC